MTDALTLEELAAGTGEAAEQLRAWQEIGLIGARERFGVADAERVRLIRFLLGRGFSADVIARADLDQDGLIDRFLSLTYPSGRLPSHTLTEVAGEAGLDPDVVRRFWEAAGLYEYGDRASNDDVAMCRGLAIALGAGVSEASLAELVRVYADSMRRVAEAEARMFHFHVHEQLRAEGLSGDELMEVSDAASGQLQALVEPAVLYFHRKGQVGAFRDDLALHVGQEAGLSEATYVPGTLQVAVVFDDLSRFTPLTEAMGDVAAAAVVERFATIVRTTVHSCHGRVVKQIGDEFMLMFFEPSTAVTCALELEDWVVGESQFPAVRLGAHWGEVLYREGDYVGSTVNVAARVAAQAQAHEVLVTSALRSRLGDLPGVEFTLLGTRALKGVAEPVELHAVRRGVAATATQGWWVDPVCGMELSPGDVVARLDVAGELRGFCSDACLQLFVAAPERYTT